MATIIAQGRQIAVNNLTLSATDDTQVGFSQPVNTIIIKCRTAADIQVRSSRGSSVFYTIASGSTLTLNMVGNIINGVVQPTNVWLRSVSATPIAEIIGLYGG